MSNKYWFLLLVAVAFSFLAFIFYFLIKIWIKDSEEKRRTAIVTGTKRSRKFSLFKLFQKLVQFKLTRSYLLKLQRVYEIRIPNDSKQSKEKAMALALQVWIVDLLVIIVLFCTKPTLLRACTAIFFVYVFSGQIARNKVHKFDLELISQLSTFIDDVRHQYFIHEMVDEAIEGALEKAPKLMVLHGQAIYDVITSYDIDDALQTYASTVPSYFLKMFADTCAKIMQYGDKDVDNQSLFLQSIQNLKEEIQMEQLKQKNLSHKFMFLIPISVIPVLGIGPLISFCCTSFSAMADLFNGNYGKIAVVLMFAATIGVYNALIKLRESFHIDLQPKIFWKQVYETKLFKRPVNSFLAKNWSRSLKLKNNLKMVGSKFDMKTWTTRNFILFIATLTLAIIGLEVMHLSSKQAYGSSVLAVASTTSGASDDECFEMLILARQLLENYKDYDFRKDYNAVNPDKQTPYFDKAVRDFTRDQLVAGIGEGVKIDEAMAYSQVDLFLGQHDSTTSPIKQLKGISYKEASTTEDPMIRSGFSTFEQLVTKAGLSINGMSDDVKKSVGTEVAKEIRKYQNEFFHWYDLVVAILLAIFAYNFNTIIMFIERIALQADMDDEVIQYKSSIMLLMHIERMTVEIILDSMLMISRIFEPSIQKCINDLPLDENRAFDTLIDDEPFDAFKRLVENLRMVDKVGVKRAFSTVKSERKNYQEKRKQENAFSAETRGSIAGFVSFLPFYVLILLYMIIPFVIEAISEFQHALDAMQTYL